MNIGKLRTRTNHLAVAPKNAHLAVLALLLSMLCSVFACGSSALLPQHTSKSFHLGPWTATVEMTHVTDSLGSVTCWSADRCAALGHMDRTGYYVLFRFNPSTGTFHQWDLTGVTTSQGPARMACTNQACLVAADLCEPIDAASGQVENCYASIARQSGLRNWSIVFRMREVGGLMSGISCGDTQTCVAIGAVPVTAGADRWIPFSATTTDAGMHWHMHDLSQLNGTGLATVACYQTDRCLGTSDTTGYPYLANTYSSDDGGITWQPTGQLQGLGPDEVDCSQSGNCIAPTDQLAYLPVGGAPWHPAGSFIRRTGQPITGSCATSQSCVVLIATVWKSRPGIQWTDTGGITWNVASVSGRDSMLFRSANLIQCLSPTKCVAVSGTQPSGGEILLLRR